jgi:hypothetical protein
VGWGGKQLVFRDPGNHDPDLEHYGIHKSQKYDKRYREMGKWARQGTWHYKSLMAQSNEPQSS